MSKKKRVFDIDFEGIDTPHVPAGTDTARRGPMATAITENADALQARQQAEAAIRAENDALAHEHVRLKKAGLITDLVPLDRIRTDKLTRDRSAGRDPEIDDLKRSIAEIGLSNPIMVEPVGDGFELIQGFRRFTAYLELHAETKDETFARIPAGINAKGEDILRLYRRMVDENMVRRGVSFGEMAQLAMNYRTQDPELQSYDEAVELLYASASRQKRSYIKHFVRLLAEADGALRHIDAIPRALGLSVVRKLEEIPQSKQLLREVLATDQERSAQEEQAALKQYLDGAGSLRRRGPAVSPAVARKAKTTFSLSRPEGEAKCTVAGGRLELKLARDFSGVEQPRLEAAVAAFLAALDD